MPLPNVVVDLLLQYNFLRIYISIISPIQKDNVNILKFPSERHIIENSKDTKLVEKTSESIKLEFLFFLESF